MNPCERCGQAHTRCSAHNVKGGPCMRPPNRGGRLCRGHGGAKPDVLAKDQVRATVIAWGLHDEIVDPGETLLKLLSASARRANDYAAELTRMIEAYGGIGKALVGDQYMTTEDGKSVKVGEYIRGMAKLEAEERDRAARFATQAVAAGLAERQVRIAEQLGGHLAELMRAALADPDLALSAEQRAAMPAVLHRHLTAIGGGE